jgi:voltage-gated sodium channel
MQQKEKSHISKLFLNDYFILSLIMTNALLIFYQEFQLQGSVLDFLEPVFTLLFVMEIIVKVRKVGFANYFEVGWNRFDFVVIAISIPSLAVIFYNYNLSQLNIFLTLRVFRVFKFFRVIRFFPNVNSIISSVQRALKSTYVVISGFFLSVFIISLVTCSLYKNIAPEYFRNPLESFYTIFRLFSVEGWYEIPDLIASRTNETIAFFSKAYFIVLLLGGGIIGLSIVNSIFVDAMVSDNNDELEKEVGMLSDKIDRLTQEIETLNSTLKIGRDSKDSPEY